VGGRYQESQYGYNILAVWTLTRIKLYGEVPQERPKRMSARGQKQTFAGIGVMTAKCQLRT